MTSRAQHSRAFYCLNLPYNTPHRISTRSGKINNTQSIRFGLFLLVLFALEAALTLFPSRILITGHEGDLLHMIDAGLRMADGEVPHLDFMTPIGILGFAPFALFLKLGSPAGQAAVLANLLFCLMLLPATWWVGRTRFAPRMAWLFGAAVIVLCTALVHGNGSIAIGFSMYYNRWSWAVTLIILSALLFNARGAKAASWIDPVIVGLGLAILALTKMTFFVPLVFAILLILLTGKRFQFALRSILTGAIVAGLIVLFWGVDFVVAYAEDLLVVATGGAGRSYPGLDIAGVLADPHKLSATLVILTSIIYFRKTGKMQQGLALLILAPAFVYITFQNWGNDPKWLYFLVLYLAMNLPQNDRTFFGMPSRQAGVVLIAVAATAALASITSLASSTTRAAFASFEDSKMIPLPEGIADLWMLSDRILVAHKTSGFIDESEDDEDETVSINDDPLPVCKAEGGLIALANAMARELDNIPEVGGKQVLTADILNIGWLMGGLPRVKGAAVWYYDDLSGFDAAVYFSVPTCPVRPNSRKAMVENMLETGWTLEERYSSPLMKLYRIQR